MVAGPGSLHHDSGVKWQNLVFVGALALAVGCEKKAPEPKPEAPKEPSVYTGPELPGARKSNPHASNPHAGDPHAGMKGPAGGGAQKLGIAWTDPASWRRVDPKSSMRKASYAIPKAKGDPEDGELHLFYFGPKFGGGVDANVDRWLAQFPDTPRDQAKRSDREVGGHKQTLVEIERGLFMSGPPMGKKVPKKDFALLGAIVSSPTGHYFFKMTGPMATVKAARKDFIGLLDSIKPVS